jgi:hypothetical protein
MSPIITMLLVLIGVVVIGCAIMIGFWFVKVVDAAVDAAAAAAAALVLAAAAAAAEQGQVPDAGAGADGGLPPAP